MHPSVRPALALCLGLSTLFFPPPCLRAEEAQALSPTAETLERVQTLEKDLARLRQDLGLDGKAGQVLVRPAGREPWLSLGGLLQVQGEFGEKGDSRYTNDNDRIYLRRAQLWAQGRFLEDFDFKAGLGMSDTLANDPAGATLGLSGMDEYITANLDDALKLRLGQFKAPYGAEWQWADPEMATPERSLGSDKLTLNRQVGAQVLGDLFDKRLGYALALVNGNGRNQSYNDNNDFLYLARLGGVPLRKGDNRLSLGAGGGTALDTALKPGSEFKFTTSTAGVTQSFTGQRFLGSADLAVKWGPVDLAGEYLRVWWDPYAAGCGPTAKAQPEKVSESFMGQAAVFVLPKALQAVAKWESFHANVLDDASPVETWTLGLNWQLKGNDLKLMLDYSATHDPTLITSQSRVLSRLQTLF